ncbi:gastrin-releasing peptide-like [Sphaeramia orbicularis]|uniref:gastrin-releasing peptide-like n=1 Tax=Sphaeramia orbicularis TaxID=375764 RepID=UPI00117C0E07|nr:gastrin-releasing peptide-like [Sphaeramia orbicularis]
MGGVCLCAYSWTCRPVLPLFLILATMSCLLHCSESPAPAVGKMYPRGNHWAVGHLMGKKSINSLQDTPQDTVQPRVSETAAGPGTADLDPYQRLIQALLQQKPPRREMTAQRANSRWREEERDKYLREMSELLLLALNLQDDTSS